jgi:hypothetical protein
MKIDRSSSKSEKSTEKPVIGKLARQKAAEAKGFTLFLSISSKFLAAEEKSQTKKKAPKKSEKDNKFPKFQENKLLAEEKMTLEKISESYSTIVKTIKDHMMDITDLKNAKTEDKDSLYQVLTQFVRILENDYDLRHEQKLFLPFQCSSNSIASLKCSQKIPETRLRLFLVDQTVLISSYRTYSIRLTT